jgi:hypothetical protein
MSPRRGYLEMYKEHERIFSQVAAHAGYWIFVRLTNKESIRYMNLPGYAPKRIDCKAKTADKNSTKGIWQLAGLVVDHRIHANVYNPDKINDAATAWRDFETHVLAKPGTQYSVDGSEKSKHYGCVMLSGKYIYSDYDLWDIIDPANPRRNFGIVEELHGQTHIRNPLQRKVEECLAGTPVADLVQHSGEMQFKVPTDQPIDAFGPKGEVVTLLNLLTWKTWCKEKFEGRISIGERY